MAQQPIPSLIPNVVVTGLVNAGKSSLINALMQQEVSIVSSQPGTTTDPVSKRFELLGTGPINFIDTAGFGDASALGQARTTKSSQALAKADVVLQVHDASQFNPPKAIPLASIKLAEEKRILVFTKVDLISQERLASLKSGFAAAHFVQPGDAKAIEKLLQAIGKRLQQPQSLLLDNIKLAHKLIVHVMPIDSEAPKGRLILPQMQLLRECLDLHYTSIVLQPSELADYLSTNPSVGLIVTDSQAFAQVSQVNAGRYPLTSYSILQARHKGDLKLFLQGLAALAQLPKHSRILLMESCSHNTSHEDIGRVKIPALLNKLYQDQHFELEFAMGSQLPALDSYQAVIHCGSCMLSRQVMQERMTLAQQDSVPMLNYGLFLAHAMGILAEATAIFENEL